MKEEGRSQRGPAGDNVIMIRLHGGEREREEIKIILDLYVCFYLMIYKCVCGRVYIRYISRNQDGK